MKKLIFTLVLFCFVVPLWHGHALAQSNAAQDALPAWDDLEPGTWTQILPGGETICALGDPYAFFVRPAVEASDELMIYFQGGGACWFGAICDIHANPSYDPYVDEDDTPPDSGIFEFDNPQNPFASYNVVFMPYCTGDVFLGNQVATYSSDVTESFTIQHKGFVNASAVLDWTFANFQQPSTVFVTGSSAGAIPTPFYTQFIAEAYPDARIEQLGDAGGGYRNQVLAAMVFRAWGTMDILTDLFDGIRLGAMNFEMFYRRVGAAYPEISFSQYNAAYDDVQAAFLSLGGLVIPDMYDLMLQNYADIEAEIDNFATYTAPGELHTILLRPEFYTYTVEGVPFVDWVTQLAHGEVVESITCTDCDMPQDATP